MNGYITTNKMRYKKFIFDTECVLDLKEDMLIFPFQEEYLEYQEWAMNNPNDFNRVVNKFEILALWEEVRMVRGNQYQRNYSIQMVLYMQYQMLENFRIKNINHMEHRQHIMNRAMRNPQSILDMEKKLVSINNIQMMNIRI